MELGFEPSSGSRVHMNCPSAVVPARVQERRCQVVMVPWKRGGESPSRESHMGKDPEEEGLAGTKGRRRELSERG